MGQAAHDMERRATEIVGKLRDAGFEAYFAGGCVRNRLLGVPAKDFDIATAARPNDVKRLFPKAVGVGLAFGVMIVPDGSSRFEVATFRSDGPYVDGRRPESVTFADHERDVRRRDFTINGMLYDPLEKRLIDLVGGRAFQPRPMLGLN